MTQVTKDKLDEVVKRIDGNVKEIKKQTIRTNNRVTNLEKWKWKITGAIAVILVILSPAIYVFFSDLLPKILDKII